MRKLNLLVRNKRQLYTINYTTLSDLNHSFKTPPVMLQTILRSLCSSKQTTIAKTEPIMLDRISSISQQIGHYLNRGIINSGKRMLTREIHSAPALLDNLTVALKKSLAYKGGDNTRCLARSDLYGVNFIEVTGNVLENACNILPGVYGNYLAVLR